MNSESQIFVYMKYILHGILLVLYSIKMYT